MDFLRDRSEFKSCHYHLHLSDLQMEEKCRMTLSHGGKKPETWPKLFQSLVRLDIEKIYYNTKCLWDRTNSFGFQDKTISTSCGQSGVSSPTQKLKICLREDSVVKWIPKALWRLPEQARILGNTGNMTGLLNRSPFWDFTYRHTTNFNMSTLCFVSSTPALVRQPPTCSRTRNVYSQRSQNQATTKAYHSFQNKSPPVLQHRLDNSSCQGSLE